MKKILFVIIVLLITSYCNKKEEEKFEAFSPEAFAYDIGDSWEINAMVNVKGFVTKESGNELSASIFFSVDMIGPDTIEVKDIFSDDREITSDEIIDIPLEAQFELDYSFPDGLYKLIFNIADKNSEETASAMATFELKR